MSSNADTTMVFGPAGLACSLNKLMCINDTDHWQTHNDDQRKLMRWLKDVEDNIGYFDGPSSIASANYAVLNLFLQQHGLSPMFRPFGRDEFGVASAIDLMFGWRNQGTSTYIRGRKTGQQHRAFTLRGNGVEVYDSNMPGTKGPLVRLRATNNVTIWAIKANRPTGDISMLDMAIRLVRNRVYVPNVKKVHMPTIEIDCTNNLSWLLGVQCGDCSISQAAQHVKARINELGGRMISGTAVAAARSIAREVTFDEPFLLWATQEQGAFNLPTMICYVASDSWKAPQGSFEDLSR